MSHILKFSEALALGLHAAALVADGKGRRVSVGEMAEALNASLAHLQKVLQRMTKAHIVASTRGPKGGYVLTRSADEIPLMEVFEAIDGPFPKDDCLFGNAQCKGGSCILGCLIMNMNKQVYDYLTDTYLSDIQGKIIPDEGCGI